jgi:Arc/MetJ-type ribon-helix-helix transcriptional regulator
VVYSCVVGRTQIYLGDAELALLDRVAEATGASRSELVRRAVRSVYGAGLTRDEKLAALRASAGVWADRPFTGAEYVDSIRGDLNDRLRRLGLD